MFKTFNELTKELDKLPTWNKAKQLPMTNDNRLQGLNPWTTMVFGDHKQGKKTALNNIVVIAKERFYPEFVGCNFNEMKTACVQ